MALRVFLALHFLGTANGFHHPTRVVRRYHLQPRTVCHRRMSAIPVELCEEATASPEQPQQQEVQPPPPPKPEPVTPEVPTSAVGLTGGDIWSGTRGVTKQDVQEVVDTALSTTIAQPIIAQYYPDRFWLWKQWSGTIVRRVLPKDVLRSILFASIVSLVFKQPFSSNLRYDFAEQYLAGFARVWQLTATMVTFTMSFFLSQSYSLWRSVYELTRRVQGRLNDIGLMCAAFAQRDKETGRYTEKAEALLALIARYVRLWNMLFYASVTTAFAPLKTPDGLSALVEASALTADEREGLLSSSLGHESVIGWLSVLIDGAVADGTLGVSTARESGTSPIAVQIQLQNKLTELRATYASLPDALSGRMPLAYVQLVQILTDFLVLSTPFALAHSLGGLAVVSGTAVVTLFHSSIVNLAKYFLDPLNNEVEQRGGDSGIGGIDCRTLIQETNLGSERWRKSSAWVPPAVQRQLMREPSEEEDLPPPSPPPEPGLMSRIFGSPEPGPPPEVNGEQQKEAAGSAASAGGVSDDAGASAGADGMVS